MFYDLSIPFTEDIELLKNLLKRAHYLGYNVVAIDYITDNKLDNKHINPILSVLKKLEEIEKNESKVDKTEPVLLDIDESEDEASNNSKEEPPNKKVRSDSAHSEPQSDIKPTSYKIFNLCILTRLTLVLSTPSDSKGLNNSPKALSQYDLIAVNCLGDDKHMNNIINGHDIDIMVLPIQKKLGYFIKYNTVQAALDKGVFFEIGYSEAIRDPISRRFMFSNATSLARALKAQNMLFSSRAKNPLELRSPYDVANLAHLFGLNTQIGKHMVSKFSKMTLMRAMTRKSTAKGVVWCKDDIDV